jgi:pilus assembly protein CpaF
LLHLEIQTPGQPVSRFELPTGSYTIGRNDACKIRLRHPEISERHALLAVRPDGTWIEDLNASNGTFLDEHRVQGRQPLRVGQSLRIGPYLLALLLVPASPADGVAPPQPPHTPTQEKTPPPPTPVAATPAPTAGAAPTAATPSAPSRDPQLAIRREIKNQIHREVIQRLDIKRMTAARVDADELQQRAREAIQTVIEEVRQRQRLPPGMDPARLAEEICNEALRLGPLEEFLADESVNEIMVNGPKNIFVERGGKLLLTGQDFMDEASVQAIIERIVAPIGRRIDESQPYVDARLPDGSRVNAIIPPLSLSGPCITIRKFSKRAFTAADFVRFQTWTDEMTKFLHVCVMMRKNMVVSGGTGSGKTSLLNVLSSYIPAHERILTIEDAAELRLNQPHVIRLEARPPNIEGRGAITIRDLVRNALRMRPDRIIVGECRGGEALDMLQAMNTGHDGSLTTVHANSPRDVIARLETMVLMSGMELPSRAIREQIASAIDLVVHESRLSDGSRKVTAISEVVGIEGTQLVMQDIFEFAQTGLGEGGKVQGYFRATGAVPTFFEDLKARGLELDPTIFQPDRERPAGKDRK